MAGFTMVEIALCLAIVGFALIAIIGVLPAGLNVQKENREETIINQESTVWMDALRSGSFGYDELARYVDRVVVSSGNFDTNGAFISTVVTVAERNPPNSIIGGIDVPIAFGNNGAIIVGLLSTPRVAGPSPGVAGAAYTTNHVYAYVRALSGSAADKPPQDNADVRDLAFSYRLVVETIKSGTYDPGSILTNKVDGVVGRNLADVRLLFRWPLKQSFTPTSPLDRPEVGSGRLAFRTTLSGELSQFPNTPYYHLKPRDYKP